MNTRLLALAALSVSVFISAARAQQLGPEFAASVPAHFASPTAGFPRVATNGNGFLAAWLDFRANGDVYAARFDANANLLDANGFIVMHGQRRVSVASDGRDYLLALSDGCRGALAARVTPEGEIHAWRQVPKFGTLCIDPEIASNGQSYLAVWPLGGAVLLDRDGNTISGPFDIGSFTGFVAVASNGSDYVITGVRSNGYVVALPVNRRGEVGPDRPLVPAQRADVAIAYNGINYLVVATVGGEFHTRLLGASDLQTSAFVDTAISGNNSTPHITWTGSEWLVMYAEVTSPGGANFGVVHLNSDGTLRGVATVASSPGVQLAPDVATSGSTSLLIWSRNATVVFAASRGDLESGTQLIDVPIANVPEKQSSPTLTRAGTSIVLAWTEWLNDRGFVSRAVVVDSNGRPQAAPVDIAPTAGARIGFDGSHFVVVWNVNGFGLTYIQRFSPTLEPVDAQAIALPAGILGRSLTVGDGVALLLWSSQNPNSFGNFGDIYGAIIRTDRSMIDVSRVTIAELALDDHAPSAAWNGTEFLVTWAHARGIPPLQGLYPNPPDDVVEVRVSRDGVVLDATPRRIASVNRSVDSTAPASTGRDFLVVWHTNPYGYGDEGIFGKIVANDGSPAVGDPSRFGSSDARTQGLMNIARDRHYIVGWSSLAVEAPCTSTLQFQIIDNGQAGPITSLPRVENACFAGGVSVGTTPAAIVVAYDRLANESAFSGVSRVFTRTVFPVAGRRRAARF